MQQTIYTIYTRTTKYDLSNNKQQQTEKRKQKLNTFFYYKKRKNVYIYVFPLLIFVSWNVTFSCYFLNIYIKDKNSK